MVKNIKITLVESSARAKQNMEDTLRTLGPRKIGQSVMREQTDVVLGAVRTIRHLMTTEEVDRQ